MIPGEHSQVEIIKVAQLRTNLELEALALALAIINDFAIIITLLALPSCSLHLRVALTLFCILLNLH